MEEYKFVSTGTQNSVGGVKAVPLKNGHIPFTLPPIHHHKRFTFQPPTLPPEWEETMLEQDKQIVMFQTFITAALTLALLAVAYSIF